MALTKTESEVYRLITEEYLTPRQAARRRQCSHQAIYKTLRSLRQKGWLGSGLQGRQPAQPRPNHKIRLHAQEWNIKILHKTDTFEKIRNRANLITLDNNTVRIFQDSIEVYSGQSFYSDDPQKATSKSLQYWNRFFSRLENELDVVIFKPRSQNIKLVNQHFAEIQNELAEESEIKGEQIRVYTTDDGKLWFNIDNSFNLHEAETQHPQTAQHDMEHLKHFFNDIRDQKPPTLTELMKAIHQLAQQNQETAAGLNAVVQQLKSQQGTAMPEMPEQERIDYVG